jgi:hypothetical protein
MGGFTKFGCSTSVDTDRRLFTGIMLGTFGRSGQPKAELPTRTHNGAAVLLYLLANQFFLEDLTDDAS